MFAGGGVVLRHPLKVETRVRTPLGLLIRDQRRLAGDCTSLLGRGAPYNLAERPNATGASVRRSFFHSLLSEGTPGILSERRLSQSCRCALESRLR